MVQFGGQIIPTTPPKPGEGYLKVTGILLIVLSAIGFFMMLELLAGTSAWSIYLDIGVMRGVWIAYCVVGIFHMLYRIFMGIMGIANCRSGIRAQLLRKIAVADILVVVALSLVDAAMLGALGAGMLIIWMLPRLVLPGLFKKGASRNKAAYEAFFNIESEDA